MRQAKKKKEMVEDRFGLQVQKHDSTAVPEGSSAYHLHVHLGLVRTSEPLCFAFNREETSAFQCHNISSSGFSLALLLLPGRSCSSLRSTVINREFL
mmetsp:Transcript_31062/g.81518  ORF Transcript_31062/g.81518 Transcript_31062/m.81518 type:complete len:97 (+) Transcript_31062:25-315(+)